MRFATRALRPLTALAALAAACSLATLGGCLTDDKSDAISGRDSTDLFPKPKGEGLIPLDISSRSSFRFSEFDSLGIRLRTSDLDLHVEEKNLTSYGYAYEAGKSGYLIERRTSQSNSDSDGIYVVGSFDESGLHKDTSAALWLPDRPKLGVKWHLTANRVYEVVSLDTAIWTEPLARNGEDTVAVISHNLQRQPTILFKETYFDTVTYFHFRRGVGCVAFQRNAGGKLLAIGSIFQRSTSRYYGY